MEMEKMDKKQKSLLLSILTILSILTSTVIISQVIAMETDTIASSFPSNQSQQSIELPEDSSHLLILLSPQYAKDHKIRQAINFYQFAIKTQPGWSSNIIFLTNQTNQIEYITTLIQKTNQQKNLTASLFIGEDIRLPIKTSFQNIQKPDLSIYSTITDQNNEQLQKTICISLLFPTSSATYQQKQTQLINTLHRFSTKRSIRSSHSSTIIEQASLTTYSKQDYQYLASKINASYQTNTDPSQLKELISTQSDIVALHGHGSPNAIELNDTSSLKLTSELASSIKTVILSIDGCYTDSIYNDQQQLKSSFISSICASETMHVGFFGLLSQQTTTQRHNIINTIIPDIINGSSISEAINDAVIPFDFIFTGDPTFEIL
jgi:hypothetical protein